MKKSVLLAVCLGFAVGAQPSTFSWPASRGKALVDPGPPRTNPADDKPIACENDSRCNWGDGRGNICTDQGVCLCDASKSLARCGNGYALCTNLTNDSKNCGACGRACADGTRCAAGKCEKVSCRKGETMCGRFCADVRSDETNCGRCFNECKGGRSCVNGACRL